MTSIIYIRDDMARRILIYRHQVHRLDRLFDVAWEEGNTKAMIKLLDLKERPRKMLGIYMEVLGGQLNAHKTAAA